jgi:peptidoglycan/xylan/chitin deacetylase (PgdA/CDA1 family)
MSYKIFTIVVLFNLIVGLTPAFSDQKIPILMYHQILDSRRDLRLSPEAFQRHLDYLQEVGYNTITFKDVSLGINIPKPIILTFDDGVFSHWYVFEELLKRGMRGVFFPVYKFIGGGHYLKSDQLRLIAKSGMEIGSHGVRHSNLTKMSIAQAGYEINESKVLLEKLLNTQIITFCIPYGRYNNRTLEILERSNYHYARTTNEGISTFGQNRNFELKVIYIHNWTQDLKKEIEKGNSL